MQGLNYAAKFLRDPEMKEWKSRRCQLYPHDQLAYLDAITPFYKPVVGSLPVQALSVFSAVVSNHGLPIRVNEIARKTRLPYSKSSSQVYRLRKAGILIRREGGYMLKDGDLLLWCTIRFSASPSENVEWDKWRKAHPDVSTDTVVDEFLKHMQQLPH